jgi:DNA ligase (NAD+)
MNIDGLGDKIIEQLIDRQLIKNIDDIYSIEKNQISNLDRLGDKSAANIIDSINNSKKTTFARFIYALGIRNVGEHTAKLLEKKYNSDLDTFINAEQSDLLEIKEIGQIVAKSIVDYWGDKNNLTVVQNCLDRGVHIKLAKELLTQVLTEKIFVFTGSLNLMNRNEAKNMVENAGGQTKNSITKNTTHLVAGENSGSKLDKAKQLGLSILSEKEFLELIGNT